MTYKNMKTKLIIFLAILIVSFFVFNFSKAQEKTVDYGSDIIIDSDLDGLTDEGEKQIYGTDPKNIYTDQDGIMDGAEILNKTDPLNNLSPSIQKTYKQNLIEIETPWAWYFTRASALIGFFLLYLSIFFGLAIRTPILKKIIQPAYSFEIHSWISLQALLFALLHGIALLFDKFLSFSLSNIFVPFSALPENAILAGVKPIYLAMGIVSFYLMLILIVSSYLRKYIGFWIWRSIHFLNIVLWIFVIFHALKLGTDMKNEIVRNIFIYANAFLLLLFAVNVIARIFNVIKQRINAT
jgi:methionine sulfoxide reductase heme-binding subunit